MRAWRYSKMDEKEIWLDFRRFEEEFSLSRRTFFEWIKTGILTAYRPSKRKTLVRRSEVKRFLEASRAENNLAKIVDEVVAEMTGK